MTEPDDDRTRMMTGPEVQRLLDEAELRRLAQSYARAVDRNEPDLMVTLFVPNAVVEGPGFRLEGRQQLRGIPAMVVARFKGTLHCVMNQTVTIDGDAAHGETYTLAYHRYDAEDGRPMTLDWAIRYQDRYERSGGAWRFTHRRLVIEWARHTPVELPTPDASRADR